MTITELLTQFANPELMHNLSLADKLIAGLVTTILGMGITFVALIILQFVIGWMDQLLNRASKKAKEQPAPQPAAAPAAVATAPPAKAETDDGELIAAIAVALATQLQTSVDNIVIRNIARIDNKTPAWHQTGIIEQMNSRL